MQMILSDDEIIVIYKALITEKNIAIKDLEEKRFSVLERRNKEAYLKEVREMMSRFEPYIL